MAYTINKNMPRIRNEAAEMVRKGWSTRKAARHFGFSQSVVVKWCKKIRTRGYGPLPTLSSRPRHHPHELSEEKVRRIVSLRFETKRCAEVIHRMLVNEGTEISLSSVKRTLDRHYLVKKRSQWKRWHHRGPRPDVAQPGDLVQVDTIHLMTGEKTRIYVFTLLDVYSRFAYAKATERIGAGAGLAFVKEAQRKAPFLFNHLQTDHGPEFSKYFVRQVKIRHRHSRVRRPNDNAHLERFNRTIQEEFLDSLPRDVRVINRKLPEYLRYYNSERLHLGIDLKTPLQLIPSY
jgi:transposase InsO family protein